jgi:hypothetical protein
MARVSKGDTLTTPVLQAGYTVDNDGYGLLTCKATYKCDEDRAGTAIKRGDVFRPDSRLKCHKVSVAYSALGVATITADYVGIEAGDWTLPNVSGSATLSTEPITSHPNFFTSGANGIAGAGPYTATPSPDGTGRPAFAGNNGSVFGNDGVAPNKPLFLGFFGTGTEEEKLLYKRTAYLSPTSSFNGVLYTSQSSGVTNMRGLVGTTMGSRGPMGYRYLLPAYLGDNWQTKTELDQLLISSVSFEDYGTIYKISYELRFNRQGYPISVYDKAVVISG